MRPGNNEEMGPRNSDTVDWLIKAKKQELVIVEVLLERARQEVLHGPNSCANIKIPNAVKLAVLTEEVGEVAKWICDYWGKVVATDDLRTELIQVAAVAVAWAESLTD